MAVSDTNSTAFYLFNKEQLLYSTCLQCSHICFCAFVNKMIFFRGTVLSVNIWGTLVGFSWLKVDRTLYQLTSHLKPTMS